MVLDIVLKHALAQSLALVYVVPLLTHIVIGVKAKVLGEAFGRDGLDSLILYCTHTLTRSHVYTHPSRPYLHMDSHTSLAGPQTHTCPDPYCRSAGGGVGGEGKVALWGSGR